MKCLKLLFPITLLLIANVISANENVKYGVQASIGNAIGSDTILTDADIATIKGGDNYSFGVYVEKTGLREELIPELLYPLSGKIALNYITESEEYENVVEDFSTFSIDILLMMEIVETVHVGGGFTYHLNPSYELIYTDNSGHEKMDYESAFGLSLQAKKIFGDKFELALTYTYIEYTGTADSENLNYLHISDTPNASNFAVSFGLTF